MALNSGVKSGATKLLTFTESLLSKSVYRGIQSTSVNRMWGGHAHGRDEPYYLHAKHMYNLDRMKNQKLTLGVVAAFSVGVAVPVHAVVFQQKKTSSG